MSLSQIKTLRERRNNTLTEARSAFENITIGDDGYAEVEQAFDRAMDQVDQLDGQISRLERSLALGDYAAAADDDPIDSAPARDPLADPAPAPDQRALVDTAHDVLLRRGLGGLRGEQRQAFMAYQDALPADIRALTTQTDATGGYIIPEGFAGQIEQALLAYGGVREAAQVITTASGNDLPWPTVNDSGNSGEILTENTQVSEQDTTFGVVTFNAYTYSSKAVRVPNQLLQDSAFDLNQWLAAALATRIGRITNTHFTTGTGTSQPRGVVVASTAGVTATQNNAIADTELVDLQHSVGRAYRNNPASRWMFADSSLKAFRKLKDSDGRFIWSPGLGVDVGPTLLGKPYTINDDMDDIAGAAKPVLFGDFSKYIIRDVQAVVMMRLVERYADYNQVGFMSFHRSDGDLVDAGTNPVKHIVMPS